MEISAEGYKNRGNASMKNGRWKMARVAYTLGLELCSDDLLKKDLLRNRALAFINLDMFEEAIQDAEAAVIPIGNDSDTDCKARVLNTKALFRAGTAAYGLRDFAAAAEYFERSLTFCPQDCDSKQELAKTKARLDEENYGKYDFQKLQLQQQLKHSRVDCADYLLQTEVRRMADHGRGLFATTDIAAGALVMCEKAFAVGLTTDVSETEPVMDKVCNRFGRRESEVTLDMNCLKKVRQDSPASARYFDRFDRIPNQGSGNAEEDAKARYLLVLRINRFNSFGFRNRIDLNSLEDNISAGLWIQASTMKHACLGNVVAAFLGDLIVLRATCAIEKGQETLIRYCKVNSSDEDSPRRNKESNAICTCALCAAEVASTNADRQKRRALHYEIRDFLSDYPSLAAHHTNKRVVARAEGLYARMLAAHGTEIFRGLPRPAVLRIGDRLFTWYSRLGQDDKTFKFGNDLLKEMGITAQRESTRNLHFERAGGCPGMLGCKLAMFIARFCYRHNRSPYRAVQARSYKTLAKQLWIEIMGGPLSFDEYYDSMDSRKLPPDVLQMLLQSFQAM